MTTFTPNNFPVEVSIYDDTGKILFEAVYSKFTFELHQTENIKMVAGRYDPDKFYIISEIPTLRPVNTITVSSTSAKADGTTPITLDKIAQGSTISVTSPSRIVTKGICDGTPINLTFGASGSYTVKVTNFPQTDFEVTINAA